GMLGVRRGVGGLTAVALCLGVTGSAPASASAPASGGAPDTSAQPPRAGEQALQAAEDRAFWLGSPVARELRRQSRQAYTGRLGVRGFGLASDKFGSVVTGPSWARPRLGP